MSNEVKKRIKRVTLWVVLFVLAGLLYALFVKIAGFGYPCFFHLITGLNCPGCGITRAAMCILNFDFIGAIKANAFLIPIVLFVGWIAFYTLRRYIKTGVFRLDSGSRAADIIFVVLLVAWGIVRNIFGI